MSILDLVGWPCLPLDDLSDHEHAEILHHLRQRIAWTPPSRPKNGHKPLSDRSLRTRVLVALRGAERPLQASEVRNAADGGSAPARQIYTALEYLFDATIVSGAMKTITPRRGTPYRAPVFWTE